MSEKIRVRIAPSPTGDPHIGTAYIALFNFAFAKKRKGDFILRIEDTDRSRLVEGSEEKIYEALNWLGLNPDEGPVQGGNYGSYRQSERLSFYKQYAQKLLEKDAAYRCDCSAERLAQLRLEQQKEKKLPHYDGKCRENPPRESSESVIRLKVPKEGETSFIDEIRGAISFKNADIDDQVLVKSDGFPTYHLASVIDDHLMEITHVIRGEEWLSSTPKHVLLYQAFGWQLPSLAHLPLLRNPDKSKLSKRRNPVSVLWYREQGYLPEAILNFLALMGWSMPDEKEIFSLSEFIDKFDIKRIDPSGPVFDTVKLDWMNGEYIRSISIEEIGERISKGKFSKYTKEQVKEKLPLVRDRMKKLIDFDTLTSYFFEKEVQVDREMLLTVSRHTQQETAQALQKVSGALNKLDVLDWKAESIDRILEETLKELDWNKTELFQTTRVSVSGSTTTPPLGETLQAIGKEVVIARLNPVLQLLQGNSEN